MIMQVMKRGLVSRLRRVAIRILDGGGMGSLKAKVEASRSSNQKLLTKIELLKAASKASAAKSSHKSEVLIQAQRFYPLYRQGILANDVRALGDAVKADCYLSLLPSTLPTAFDLQRRYGGRVICDNVENLEVNKHSLAPNYDPIALQMVNDLARGAMSRCDGLMTVGGALAKTLESVGRPILVLKNFREYAEPVPNRDVRVELGIPQSSVLLFASGNVVVGFEPVLRAMAALPQEFHLLALVRLKPASYEEEMLAKIVELGLQGRVHLRPFVPYNELASLACGADIGLITSDISNPNGAVGLPNRCFDYLTAGLPVVAPAMPDVKELVDQHGFGEILTETTSNEWLTRIQQVADSLETYRAKAREARNVLTWESQEASVFEFLGRPGSVTMVGFRDLSGYQRYQRLARSLKKVGCEVRMVFVSQDPDVYNLVPGVSYYVTGDRYGVGPGFRLLTGADSKARNEA